MTQIFVKYILHLCIFRHLKLEIALAIPASNDEKWNSYTSISGSWHALRPGSQRVKNIQILLRRDRLYKYTSESDVYIRLILTYKYSPRSERVKSNSTDI